MTKIFLVALALSAGLACSDEGSSEDGDDDSGAASYCETPPDCSIAFVCDNSTSVYENEVCNGVQRCVDGADEPAGCAALTCG